jgi:transcriptional antiterminator NusG
MSNQEAKWYIVQIQSGLEKRVIRQLAEKSKQKNLEHMFEEVFVPAQEVVEVRKGKKVNVEKKFFPGYILIKMQPSRDAWLLIRSIDGVYDFLGARGNAGVPQAMTAREVAQMREIKDKISQGAFVSVDPSLFEVGESVKVVDGPFEGFVGVVEEVDQSKSKVKVSVTIFGRPAPIDLDFNQINKV